MRCSHASVWESEVKLKIERPLSQPYGCQLPFQGEPLENGKFSVSESAAPGFYAARFISSDFRFPCGASLRPAHDCGRVKPSLKGKVPDRADGCSSGTFRAEKNQS